MQGFNRVVNPIFEDQTNSLTQLTKNRFAGKDLIAESIALRGKQESMNPVPPLNRSHSMTSIAARTKELKQGKKEVEALRKYIDKLLGDTIESEVKELAFNSVLESMVEKKLQKYPEEQIELLNKVDEMRKLIGNPIIWEKKGPTYVWKDDAIGFHACIDRNGSNWRATVSIKEKKGGKYKPTHTIEGDFGDEESGLIDLTKQIEALRIEQSAMVLKYSFGSLSNPECHFLVDMTEVMKEVSAGVEITQLTSYLGGTLRWPAAAAGFDIAGFVGLPLDAYRVYSAKRKLNLYREHKKEIKELKEQRRDKEAKILEKQARQILYSSAGKLFFSLSDATSTTLQGAAAITQLASAAIAPATATALLAAGAAAGGIITATSIVDGLVNSFRFYKKTERKKLLRALQKNILQLKETALESNNSHLIAKCECLERFISMQKKVLNEKLFFDLSHIGVDVAMCAIGTLLIVSAVTGAASFGIGAGAVGGGVVVATGALVTADLVRKKQRKKKEERLRREHPKKSNLGIIAELSLFLEKEVQNPLEDQSISTYLCNGYLHIPADLMADATKELVETYRHAVHHHSLGAA